MAEARRSLAEAVAVVDELRAELDGHAATLTAPPAQSSPAATTPAGLAGPSIPSMGSGFGGGAPLSPLSGMGGMSSSGGLGGLAAFSPPEAPQPDAAAFGDGFAVRLPDGSTAMAPNAVAASAVRHALTQLGVPYQWGGTAPGVGLDCSGLTQWAYHEAGLNIPRLAQEQDIGAAVDAGSLRPGDLAVWDGHVAMIVGNGTMIEAGDPVQAVADPNDQRGAGFSGLLAADGVNRSQASTTSLMRSSVVRISRRFRRLRRNPRTPSPEEVPESEISERLGHVGPAAVRDEPVVPIVNCAVSEQDGETELPARLARSHPAGRPVDRTDFVSLYMTAKPSTHRGLRNAIEPFRIKRLRRESAGVPDIIHQRPDFHRGCFHVNCHRSVHQEIVSSFGNHLGVMQRTHISPTRRCDSSWSSRTPSTSVPRSTPCGSRRPRLAVTDPNYQRRPGFSGILPTDRMSRRTCRPTRRQMGPRIAVGGFPQRKAQSESRTDLAQRHNA